WRENKVICRNRRIKVSHKNLAHSGLNWNNNISICLFSYGGFSMSKLEIFDPAMCCSTGVCGPGVDPELTRIASAVYSLEKRGIDVTRYNLANDPSEFIENKKVNYILNEKGADILPVTILNGEIVKESNYPSNEELSTWLQIDTSELKDKPQTRVEIDIDL